MHCKAGLLYINFRVTAPSTVFTLELAGTCNLCRLHNICPASSNHSISQLVHCPIYTDSSHNQHVVVVLKHTAIAPGPEAWIHRATCGRHGDRHDTVTSTKPKTMRHGQITRQDLSSKYARLSNMHACRACVSVQSNHT